jgi:hypothetical protein
MNGNSYHANLSLMKEPGGCSLLLSIAGIAGQLMELLVKIGANSFGHRRRASWISNKSLKASGTNANKSRTSLLLKVCCGSHMTAVKLGNLCINIFVVSYLFAHSMKVLQS